MEEKTEKKKHEKDLELWKFIIELIFVFYTSSNLILMILIEDKILLFWIYSTTTIIRVTIISK